VRLSKQNLLYKGNDFERQTAPPEKSGVGLEPYRSDVRRDRARLIHCAAFRRLQGKTQLFPGQDSDFFRNRLTHSLEVAQIAESIAHRLNHEVPFFRRNPIDPDLCATAGLAHDLGHPPFGHNGEKALDDSMRDHGGFEGNAQTLRILCRLEKKEVRDDDLLPSGIDEAGVDQRLGLNLSYRVLASVLKYDNRIPLQRDSEDGLKKGYYACDKDIVDKIKVNVVGTSIREGVFKTIECQIMDIADDIAYSTYDLEDSFKAGFLSPLEILNSDPELLTRVADKVSRSLSLNLTWERIYEVLVGIFGDILGDDILDVYDSSINLARNGYYRTGFTSDLISRFLAGVQAKANKEHPPLSKAFLNQTTALQVEVLKHFNYEATIMSSRLKVAEYRGYQIVKNIFENLSRLRGHLLLPDDFRELFGSFKEVAEQKRVICDFVAGMTDRYAVEFYGRLNSEQHQSIFKPL
jgi:dGTPase